MTSAITQQDGVMSGPQVRARNWSAGVEGTLHDDKVASGFGFRGGAVAGRIHCDQFVPLLVERFGDEWLRTGFLSLYFRSPTMDLEPVQAFLADQPDGTVEIWLKRVADGLEVMRGNAGLGNTAVSALRTRDLRGGDPANLKIFRDLQVGERIGPLHVELPTAPQRAHVETGFVSDPLPEYTDPTKFGAPIAAPSWIVELLWRPPIEDSVIPRLGGAIGMYGAIEVSHVNGPVLLDRSYDVTAEVIAVGESPKTEFLWFDSEAVSDTGVVAARMRMMLRYVKGTSANEG